MDQQLRMPTSGENWTGQAVPAARPLSEFYVEQIGDELVILDGETMQYHTLNTTASRIWQSCSGTATAGDIAVQLAIPFEIVESTIAELGEAGLLESSRDHWDATVTRRRAAKLIAAGLVGAIGLPVIKSITVPDAAAAITPNQCTFPGPNCGNGNCRNNCQAQGYADGSCASLDSGGSCCVCSGSPAAPAAIFQSQDFLEDPVLPAVQQEPESLVQPPTQAVPDAPVVEEIAPEAPAEAPAESSDAQETEEEKPQG